MGVGIYRIGMISDTHELIRDEVKEILTTCQVILHGGDINRQAVLDELAQIAPVHTVKDNNDKEWIEHIPRTLCLEIMELSALMIHNKQHLPKDLGDRNLIIYGHSHRYEEKQKGGRTWLSPGSCDPRRFSQPITIAVVEAKKGREGYRIQKLEVPHNQDLKSGCELTPRIQSTRME